MDSVAVTGYSSVPGQGHIDGEIISMTKSTKIAKDIVQEHSDLEAHEIHMTTDTVQYKSCKNLRSLGKTNAAPWTLSDEKKR